MRARAYDPQNGRFITADPIGLAGGSYGLYRYVGNSPTNWIDPRGLCDSPQQCEIERQQRERDPHWQEGEPGNYHQDPYYKDFIDKLDRPFKDPLGPLRIFGWDFKEGKPKLKLLWPWKLISWMFEEISPAKIPDSFPEFMQWLQNIVQASHATDPNAKTGPAVIGHVERASGPPQPRDAARF
jgi:hypothetical protein